MFNDKYGFDQQRPKGEILTKLVVLMLAIFTLAVVMTSSKVHGDMKLRVESVPELHATEIQGNDLICTCKANDDRKPSKEIGSK